jgi:hypothetical protein
MKSADIPKIRFCQRKTISITITVHILLILVVKPDPMRVSGMYKSQTFCTVEA